MREPFKVIHKYKNSNNFIGYKIYIFVGNVEQSLKTIFSDIENLSLEDTLTKLDVKSFNMLVDKYTSSFYYFFFNKHHIIKSKNTLKKKVTVLNAWKKKFGQEWVKKHFESPENIIKPSYFDKYADYIKNKMKRTPNKVIEQEGGEENEIEDTDEEITDDIDDLLFEEQETLESTNLIDFDELNLDNVILDKKAKDTQQEIKDILNLKSIKQNTTYSFDNDKFEKYQDNQEIQNIYEKIFIYKNFIFFDDSIYKIKSKICDSVSLSNNFGGGNILPSRIYLWCEYFTQDNFLDKVMLGSKWIKKSELWNIDVEPKNDINQYINLSSKSLQDLNYAYKKYNNRIKRENDEQVVLFEYADYINNNELFMVDIYTQLNKNMIIPENKLGNLINTFIRIYFPTTVLDVQDILSFLQEKDSVQKQNEIAKIDLVAKSIANELLLEREVVNLIETTSIKKEMFLTPYITQTVVHLKLHNNDNLNLRKIFDNFYLDNNYPFLQLQLSHEKPIRKILKNKYFATLEETKEQAVNLKNWLNSNSFGLTIKVLANEEEIYNNRFLTITITELCRVQYKIQWKEENKTTVENISKTFVYVSKLIDKINKENDLSIPFPHDEEFRYIFINSIQQFKFLSSYQINHNDLSDFARLFYPYISVVVEPKKRIAKEKKKNSDSKWGTYLRFKKVSNFEDETGMSKRIVYYLKNFEVDELMLVKVIENEFNITTKEAKEKIQEVTSKFPVSKKKGRKLKKLDTIPVYKPPGIAIEIQGKTVDSYKIRVIGSRNEVQLNEITNFIQKLIFLYQETYLEKKKERVQLIHKLEKLTSIAKRRHYVKDIVVKEETDAYYSIKKMKNIDPERLKNSEYGATQYTRDCQNSGNVIRRPQQFTTEKHLLEKGYKLNKSTGVYEKNELIAIKFDTKSGPIYYTCDPEINKERKYIGILSKSKGTLPCCFKKNQLTSSNTTVKSKLLEALGRKSNEEEVNNELASHILYIKQYSKNKITHERLFFLPDILDNFFNFVNDKSIRKSTKLEQTRGGFFLLFGINVSEYKFLQAISYAVNETVNQIKNKIISVLKKDTNDKLFISLGEGDIKNQFETRKNFINFIDNSNQLDYNLVKDLIVYIYKINVVIFENNPVRQDFFVRCTTNFNLDLPFLFLFNDELNYYIIIDVVKETLESKDLNKQIIFKSTDKISNQIMEFYYQPCIISMNQININFYKYAIKEKIIYQVIDENNKVNYIITESKKLLPTNFCGTDYDLETLTLAEIDPFIVDYNEQISYMQNMDWIQVVSVLQLDGIAKYIKVILKNNNFFIDYDSLIPIKNAPISTIKDIGIEEYDVVSISGEDIFDIRKFEVNISKIRNELLQLLRLELSNYITNNVVYKERIEKILGDPKVNKKEKIKEILIKLFKKTDFINVFEGTADEWIEKKKNDIMNYKVSNTRSLCNEKENQIFCFRKKISIVREWLDDYLINITNQIVQQDVAGKEILRLDKYYVSDIVNTMVFTYRNNQMILKGNEFQLQQIIDQLYGEGILPNLGKKKINEIVIDDILEGLTDYDKYYSQKIISNNNTILRGLVNGFYYLLYKSKYPLEIINLGYKSKLQTGLVNYFKGKIMSFLRTYSVINKNPLPKELNIKTINNDTLISLHKRFVTDGFWLLIVWCFHKILGVTIYILDENNKELYSFVGDKSKVIHLRVTFNSYNKFPNEVECLYYK